MNEENSELKKKSKEFSVLGIAWNVGYMIAIPIIFYTVAGVYIDRTFGTSPLFIVIALILSVVTSMFIILKKFNSYLK